MPPNNFHFYINRVKKDLSKIYISIYDITAPFNDADENTGLCVDRILKSVELGNLGKVVPQYQIDTPYKTGVKHGY